MFGRGSKMEVAVQACYSQAAEERSAGRIPAETKECRRCHETKGKADFYHSKMTADGLQSYCKVGQLRCGTPLLHAVMRHVHLKHSCRGGDRECAGAQQCYSVASAQRRSRTAEGAITQAPGEDGQENVSLHLENGVPVYQDMSINMQVSVFPLVPCLSGVAGQVSVLHENFWLCKGPGAPLWS